MATKKSRSAAKAGKQPPAHVALLRGINVGGNKKVPMAELRELAEGLGWQRVQTYIQSGNVVFCAAGEVPVLEQRLEHAIEQHFGFAVPVVVLAGSRWLGFAARSPFAAAESERPNLLHLGVSKLHARAQAAQALAPYCKSGERVVVRGGAIWIDFVEGVARSKLTPAVLDRTIGSTVTLRNWNTVQQLAAMVQAAGGG